MGVFVLVCVVLFIAEFLALRIARNIWPQQLDWLLRRSRATKPDGQFRVSNPFPAGPLKHGTPDPIAEADVYLAYGRKQQALELLEKALQENPSRVDVETKLRELKGQSPSILPSAPKSIAAIQQRRSFIQKMSSLADMMLSAGPRMVMFAVAVAFVLAPLDKPDFPIPPNYSFVLLGFYMAVASGFSTVLGIRSLSWSTVRGRIVQKGVTEDDSLYMGAGKGAAGWTPRIRYRYAIDGREYEGDQIAFNQPNFSTQESAAKYVERFASGTECEVYHNPSDPAFSTLQRGATPVTLFCLVLGVALMAAGFLLGTMA